MKRLVAIFLCLLVLTGCGNSGSDISSAMDLRQKLTKAKGCEFDCVITADYTDVVYTFSLHCTFDEHGGLTFRVTEPETISGITGVIDSKGGKLTFDDQALVFQLMADGYISPVSAPWVFMKTLRSGYIHACGKNGEGTRMILHDSYEENPLQIDVWTDGQNNPTHSEILWQGRRILSLDVSNFQYL